MSQTHRAIVRGFLHGDVVFQRDVQMCDAAIEALALEHIEQLNHGRVSMIEFEFPDDPPGERFFRIGIDPRGMVMPIEVRL